MEINDFSTMLASLGQETRLEIFRTLIRAGSNGLSAGELSSALNIAPPTQSFHLKAMVHAGLIAQRREGRQLLYAPDYGATRQMIDFLLTDCCDGDKRLCGPYIVETKTA